MTRRILVTVIAVLALTACAASPQRGEQRKMPKSQYKGEVGESPVGAIPDVDLRDDERNKDVRITIEYPTRNSGNPLIVFSPGYGGNNNSYVGLSSYWASQGYVVIRVAHADAGKRPDGDIWLSQTQTDRRNRVRDVTFVLDSLDLLEKQFPELEGKIDRTKIIAAGHSYGAYVAMLLGGARTFPGPVSYADSRIKAIVAMSPQGTSDTRGLTNESWSEVKVPALYMTGTRDQGIGDEETPEWRRQPFELSPAGDKWLVVVEHARHGTFVGRYDAFIEAQAREREVTIPDNVPAPGGTPVDGRLPERTSRPLSGSSAGAAAVRERDLFVTIKSLALAFLDASVKADAKGREALEKAQASGGVEVKRK
jgi:predicted dienelactone hydrolase